MKPTQKRNIFLELEIDSISWMVDDEAEIKPTIDWHQDGLEISIYFIHPDDSSLSSLSIITN